MGNRIISSELMTIREELRKQQSISLEATKGASVGISGIVSVETFNQLQTKYNGMEQKLQNVNKDIYRLNAENKEYNKMNNMIKNENVSLVEKIKQISKENESLKQRNLSYLSTYPQIEPEDFESAKQEIVLLTEQLKQQKNVQDKEQNVEMNKLQKESDEYLQQVNKLKAHNKELTELMNKSFDSHDKELNALRTKRETDLAQITALNEKIVSNQAQIEKMQIESKKRTDFIDKMKEIVSLKLALQKAMNTEKTLKSEMEIKIKQLSDNGMKLKQIAALNEDKKLLTQQIEKEKQQNKEINALMSNMLDSHTQQTEALKKKKDGLMANITSKDEKINKMQAENIKMKGLMTKMKEVYNSKQAVIEKLQNEMDALKSSSNEVAADKDGNHKLLMDKLQKLEIENKKLMQNIESLKDAVQEKDKNIEQIKLLQNKECEEYKNEISEKSKTIKTLTADLSSIKEKYQSLSQDTKKYLNKTIEAKSQQQKK